MSDWRPIETEPMDGSQVLFYFSNGSMCIAPSTPRKEPTEKERELARKEMVKLYKAYGVWPDAGFTPTHWMPLPAGPEEQ